MIRIMMTTSLCLHHGIIVSIIHCVSPLHHGFANSPLGGHRLSHLADWLGISQCVRRRKRERAAARRWGHFDDMFRNTNTHTERERERRLQHTVTTALLARSVHCTSISISCWIACQCTVECGLLMQWSAGRVSCGRNPIRPYPDLCRCGTS